MKLLHSFQRVLSYIPLGWLLLFALFVLRAYYKLGRMPIYGNPDPKDLGFILHHGILFFSYFLVILSIFLWVILTGILFVKDKKIIIKKDIFIFLCFYVFMFYFGRVDILGLFMWFID